MLEFIKKNEVIKKNYYLVDKIAKKIHYVNVIGFYGVIKAPVK